MKIIPAIDIINGKCVRLTEGNYDTEKIYNTSPLDVALNYEDHGMKYLHLVDLDGAREGAIVNWKVLETMASKTKLEIDFGGGLKTNKDLEIAFNSGAAKITGGSIAVKNPSLFVSWIEQYPGRIILGADVKERKVAVSGWLETSATTIEELLGTYSQSGITEVICTDISKDGKLQGLNFDLYKELQEKFPNLKFIASGGVAGLSDLELCSEIGMQGVIIGKAIYEGKITMKELQHFASNAR